MEIYTVYTNTPTSKVRLHKINCIRSRNRKENSDTSFWTDFSTKEEAIDFMKKSNMKHKFYDCFYCPSKS